MIGRHDVGGLGADIDRLVGARVAERLELLRERSLRTGAIVTNAGAALRVPRRRRPDRLAADGLMLGGIDGPGGANHGDGDADGGNEIARFDIVCDGSLS